MAYAITVQTLRSENRGFAGSGGISQNNRSQDFHAGFYDCESRQTVISRFADGTPAPIHLLDGLPRHWVTERNAAGRVLAVKGSVVSGFIRHGRFYTRAQAAAWCEQACMSSLAR